MSVSEIHHAAITVSDLEASAAFYQQVLGFRRTLEMPIIDPDTMETMGLPRGATGQSLYLQGPTRIGQLELIQWSEPPANGERTRRPPSPGVFLLSFETTAEEIDRIHAEIDPAKVTVNCPPRRSILENYGEITVMIVEDPDGLMVELVALPTREQIMAFRAEQAAKALPQQ